MCQVLGLRLCSLPAEASLIHNSLSPFSFSSFFLLSTCYIYLILLLLFIEFNIFKMSSSPHGISSGNLWGDVGGSENVRRGEKKEGRGYPQEDQSMIVNESMTIALKE